ncbi:MAG: CDP-alcohol phosphatidyltransferase family protein [Thermoplasmata archaeon]
MNIKRIIPDIFTLLNGGLGIAALYYIFAGNLLFASFLVLSAGGFDGLDGFFARRLNTFSKYGSLYDSISDSVSFVIAPSMMVMVFFSGYTLDSSVKFYISFFLAALVFAAGIARLTKFTVKSSSLPYFEGVPTPFVAITIITAIFISHFVEYYQYNWFIGILIGYIAIAMILPIKYPKAKNSKVSFFLGLVIGISIVIAIVLKLLSPFISYNMVPLEISFSFFSMACIFGYIFMPCYIKYKN